MGSVRGPNRAGKLQFANRLQLGCAIAVCLVALGICGTSLAEDAHGHIHMNPGIPATSP